MKRQLHDDPDALLVFRYSDESQASGWSMCISTKFGAISVTWWKREKAKNWGLWLSLLLLSFIYEVPRLFIDVLNLPVPRPGGRLVALLPILLLLAWLHGSLFYRRFRQLPIEPEDTLFIMVLTIWTLLELWHGMNGHETDLAIVEDNAWCYFAFWLFRVHLALFRDINRLRWVAWRLAMSIGCTHTLLLLLEVWGVRIPMLNYNELLQRNGLSLLMTFAVYLILLSPDRAFRKPSRVMLTIVLSSFQIALNHARGAAIVLAMLLVIGGLRRILATRSIAAPLFIVASLFLAGAVTAQASLTDSWITHGAGRVLNGTSDDGLSTDYRLRANSAVLSLFEDSPLIGAGGTSVFAARAGGYITHTYYLMPLAAYGMIGMIPYLLCLWGICMRFRVRLNSDGLIWLSYLIAICSFVNDLYGWFGLGVALVLPAIATKAGKVSSVFCADNLREENPC